MSGFSGLTRALGVSVSWLVNAKSELHAFDGPRGSVLACLAVELFPGCALPDHVGRLVAFETGRLELLDAPGIWVKKKLA